MGVLKVPSADKFDEFIRNPEGKAVFVDFFAEWCPPCRMVAPVLEELSAKFPDIIFLKVDVDQCQDLAQRFSIRAMPTFIAFRKGEEVEQVVGADVSKIEALLAQYGSPVLQWFLHKLAPTAALVKEDLQSKQVWSMQLFVG